MAKTRTGLKHNLFSIIVMLVFACSLVFGGGFVLLSLNKSINTQTINFNNIEIADTAKSEYTVSGGAIYSSNADNKANLMGYANNQITLNDNSQITINFKQVNRLLSTNSNKVASTLIAKRVNNTIYASITDSEGKVELTTSADAEYSLGTLITGTNDILYVENATFNLNSKSNNNASLMALTTKANAQIMQVESGTITFKGNKSYDGADAGRAFYQTGGTLNLNGVNTSAYLTLTNFKSSEDGGAIYSSGGTLNFNYVNLNNCEATESGGGVFGGANATINISNSTLTSNTATDNGGAICSLGTASLTSNTLSSNTAASGGAINIYSGTATLTSNSISSNTATNGAGLYNKGTSTISGGTFTGNVASSNGGAIYSYAGTVTLQSNATIGNASATTVATSSSYSNKATSNGGGIYATSGATLNLTSATIAHNIGAAGGGIFSASTSDNVSITSATIKYNSASSGSGGGIYTYGKVTATGGTVTRNTAYTYGGGLMLKTSSAAHSISGMTINYNTATNNEGGGVRLDGSVNFTSTYVSDNTSKANAGGVSVTGVTATFDKCSIDFNTTSGAGGGIYNVGTLTLTDTSVASNTSTGAGGGIYNSGTLTHKISGTSVKGMPFNSSSNNGGAIYNASGTTNITGISITDNSCATYGGGIYIGGGTVNLNSGTVFSYGTDTSYDNTCSSYGTAICVAGGTLNIKGATVNYHTNSAIYQTAGTINISSGAVSYNSGANGGAIYKTGGTLNITGGSLNYNTATGNGGAVYNSSGAINLGTASTSTNSSAGLSNNSAVNGGAIYTSGAIVLNGATISTNTASSDGGGIYLNGVGITMYNGSISSNTATSEGGGVFHNNLQSSVTITLHAGSISSNKATMGGGLHAYYSSQASVTVTINICRDTTYSTSSKYMTFSGNSATTSGGAMYLNGQCVDTYIGYSTSVYPRFTSNSVGTTSSSYVGGAIHALNSAYLYVYYAKFDSNSAYNGGAIYSSKCVTNYINNGSFTNNTANNHGAAVHCKSGSTIKGTYSSNSGKDTIYVASGYTVTVNATMSSNTGIAIKSEGNLTIAGGTYSKHTTVVHFENASSTLSLEGGTFSSNSRAFWIEKSKSFTATAGTFTSNTGTVIYCDDVNTGTTSLSGITATSNTGTYFLYYLTNNALTVSKSTFSKNKLVCYITNGTTITFNNNCVFDSNSAAITAVKATILNIDNCTIKNDSNYTSCWGIDPNSSVSTFNLTNTTFSKLKNGAILSLNAGTSKIDNCTFNDCDTPGSGSAINYMYGNLSITDCYFTDCDAEGNGGAIYFENGEKTVTISGTRFEGCSADNGGAIYGYTNLTITTSSFDGCTALDNGGAIAFVDEPGGGSITLKLDNGTTICSCSATSGGAIFSEEYLYVIGSSELYENSATSGGAVFCTNSSYFGYYSSTNTPVYIYDNEATYGGAIYATGYVRTGEEAEIDNNYASTQGGAIYKNSTSTMYVYGGFIDNAANVTGNTLYLKGTGYNYLYASIKEYKHCGSATVYNCNSYVSIYACSITSYAYLFDMISTSNSYYYLYATPTLNTVNDYPEFWLSSSSGSYLRINTNLTNSTAFEVEKDGITNGSYIAYSTNSTYRNTALKKLYVSGYSLTVTNTYYIAATSTKTITFNISGYAYVTYNGTKYTSTVTLTLNPSDSVVIGTTYSLDYDDGSSGGYEEYLMIGTASDSDYYGYWGGYSYDYPTYTLSVSGLTSGTTIYIVYDTDTW